MKQVISLTPSKGVDPFHPWLYIVLRLNFDDQEIQDNAMTQDPWKYTQ